MAGELKAIVEGIVKDAATTGKDIATKAAAIARDTAERAETSADEWAASDSKAAEKIKQAGTRPGDPLAPKPAGDYTYNMVDNPGPLATRPGTPAANFAGGRYDEVELTDDRTLYRGGDSQGSPLGQWFSTDPPAGVAEVRIDTAVKPQWTNPETGEWQGASPIDAVYTVQIPAGTTVYPGPVANQGGIYVGGGNQIFVPEPWKIPGVTVVGSEPLK